VDLARATFFLPTGGVQDKGKHTATYKTSEELLTTQAHSSECKNPFFRNIAAGSYVKCK